MADVQWERKQPLSRAEASAWLSELAEALADDGGRVRLPVAGGKVEVAVPDRLHAELEVEVEGDEVEIEIELRWSTRSSRTDADEAVPS